MPLYRFKSVKWARVGISTPHDSPLPAPYDDETSDSDFADGIIPGPGRALLFTSGGRDHIRAVDGSVDRIDCDSGRDTLLLDRLDFYGGECRGDQGLHRAIRRSASDATQTCSRSGCCIPMPSTRRTPPRICG